MLKFKYESDSEIPANLKEYFTEKDGVFILQVEGVKTDADIEAYKKVADKEREARREAEVKLKKYSLLPDDFTIEEYNRLIDTNRGGDIEARLKQQRESITAQHEKEKKGLLEQLAEKENLVHTHVKTASLHKAMAELNIAKPFIPAVEAMMQSRIKVEGTDVFLDEKPVSEALKEWIQTDIGKNYVAAANNSGGGSNNTRNANGSQGKTMARSEFETMSPSQRMEFSKAGGKLTD